MNQISRKDAQLAGLKRYFTGQPCTQWHISERYVANGHCIECQKHATAKFKADRYKPTGYGRGRPRKGEVRPPSPNAIRTAAYYKKRLAEDPEFRKTLNNYYTEWRAMNPERAKEIEREKAKRARERKENGD